MIVASVIKALKKVILFFILVFFIFIIVRLETGGLGSRPRVVYGLLFLISYFLYIILYGLYLSDFCPTGLLMKTIIYYLSTIYLFQNWAAKVHLLWYGSPIVDNFYFYVFDLQKNTNVNKR